MQATCEKIARMFNSLPPLNAVRAFVAAARHQSFTIAARELHVTHGAVSRQIKTLEAHMGVRLFERQIRQVSLTVEGLRFFEQADAALRQIAAAAQLAMRQPPARVIRINVRPSFAVRWLIPRLPDFVAQYPGIEPHVHTSTLPPDKVTDSFDVAIRRGLRGWPASLQVRPFLEDEICVVGAPGLLDAHPLADPSSLASCVLLWSKTRKDDWDAWLRRAGVGPIKPTSQMQFDHVHFVLQATLDGLGIAITPISLASNDLAAGRLRCPFPDLTIPATRYYYATARDAVPEARYFVEWLESELARQNAD